MEIHTNLLLHAIICCFISELNSGDQFRHIGLTNQYPKVEKSRNKLLKMLYSLHH